MLTVTLPLQAARMRRPMRRDQLVDADVCVDLGGLQIGVSQHRLDEADVGAARAQARSDLAAVDLGDIPCSSSTGMISEPLKWGADHLALLAPLARQPQPQGAVGKAQLEGVEGLALGNAP